MRSLAIAIAAVALTGCLSPSAQEEPVEAAATPAPTAAVPVEIAYEGETEGYGCAWALVAGRCVGMGGENVVYELDDAPLGTVAGEITWTPRSAATADLGVSLCVEDDDGWMCGEDSPYEMGGSPLAFDFEIGAEGKHALIVWHWVGTPTPAGAGGSLPQAFAVAATLTPAS